MDPLNGFGCEHHPGKLAGQRQTVVDIISAFLQGQRENFVANGDALIQLFQLRFQEAVVQFLLPDEDDLQQLFLLRFQIGQQANLLQHLEAQGLGFVNNQHGGPALGMLGEQVIVQGVEHLLFGSGLNPFDLVFLFFIGIHFLQRNIKILKQPGTLNRPGRADVQFLDQSAEQVHGRNHRIQHQRHIDFIVQTVEKRPAQGGLARSHSSH